MKNRFEDRHFEMAGMVNIKEVSDSVHISIDTGASLEHFSIQQERFDRIKGMAQKQELPVDVFIDRCINKFGFDKNLFDRILEEENQQLKDKLL